MRFCRDEHCNRLELHPEHESFEIEFESKYSSKSSILEPWKRPATKALDYSITNVTSQTYPKPFDAILRDVRDDYGECNWRTVQRRLRRLVEHGRILQINLGRRLYAYVKPGSNMINDHDLMREQIKSMMVMN